MFSWRVQHFRDVLVNDDVEVPSEGCVSERDISNIIKSVPCCATSKQLTCWSHARGLRSAYQWRVARQCPWGPRGDRNFGGLLTNPLSSSRSANLSQAVHDPEESLIVDTFSAFCKFALPYLVISGYLLEICGFNLHIHVVETPVWM